MDKTFSVEEPLGGGTPLLDEERQGQSRENFPIPPLLSLFFSILPCLFPIFIPPLLTHHHSPSSLYCDQREICFVSVERVGEREREAINFIQPHSFVNIAVRPVRMFRMLLSMASTTDQTPYFYSLRCTNQFHPQSLSPVHLSFSNILFQRTFFQRSPSL